MKNESGFSVFDENGEILPIPAELDHFAFLGLPRKLGLDGAALEKRYYALSRRLHPDFFLNAPAAKKIRSLDASARLNEAYRILKDPLQRAVYLVEILSGKMEENHTRPPADLFEQILEVQEAVADLKRCEEGEEVSRLRDLLAAARKRFDGLRSEQRADLDALGEQWDAAIDAGASPPDEIIEKMRSIFGLRNYIDNVLRSIEEALETV